VSDALSSWEACARTLKPSMLEANQPARPRHPGSSEMTIATFVGNNYIKRQKHFAAKIYATLCYGDLDRELDFSSCEISFCSPAGQPRHYAIPC